MPAITKNELRIKNLDRFKSHILNIPSYVFLSGTSLWDNENSPPIPKDSTDGENEALADLFGLKRIQASDVVSVLPRINWLSGVTYDAYQNDVNMVDERNVETGDFYRFYVFTDENHVYKCLSNNYGSQSNIKPTGTNPAPFTTSDGYIWKYMYTISINDALKFATSNWIPCYTIDFNDGSTQWISQQAAVSGTIDDIVVTAVGTGYDSLNPPTIEITGDGTGAEATATVGPLSGEVEDITITNPGSGYTQASVSVVDSSGVGATAEPVIAPRKGHGADPRVELGATYLMTKVTVDGSEGTVIPVGIEYRISGIISMPGNANDSGFALKTLPDGARLYSAGETITGATSGATANVVLVDSASDLLYINNVTGNFSQNESISSQTYNSTQIDSLYSAPSPLTSLVYSANDYEENSGNVLYVGYREKVTRVEAQKEDIIAIMSF